MKSLVFISFIIFFNLAGCSRAKLDQNIQAAPLVVSYIQPSWFKVSSNHSLLGNDQKALPHLFYDVAPDFTVGGTFVNAVVTTPINSEFEYELDLLSGQRYYTRSYCENSRTTFAMGVIPRVLDQLGKPQKVIIFGDTSRLESDVDNHFVRVHLIGSFIEKYCPQSNCDEKSAWLSRLVFIGVDSLSEDYAKIRTLDDFRQMHNWESIRKEIISHFGVLENRLLQKEPLSISEILPLDDTIEFFRRYSTHLTEKKLEKIQRSCHLLYEKLWNDVGVEKEEDLPVKNFDQLKIKMKLVKELELKKIPVGFAKRFAEFTKKYKREMFTCTRFVYPGNLNQDFEKFWFYAYTSFYFRLHDEGYYFDCINNSWQNNLLDNRGKLNYELEDMISRCTEENLDYAMKFLSSSFIAYLKGNAPEYFKFIDYDNFSQGTHNKIYSWTRHANRKNLCLVDGDEKLESSVKDAGQFLFPDDGKWKKRSHKDFSIDSKIIY